MVIILMLLGDNNSYNGDGDDDNYNDDGDYGVDDDSITHNNRKYIWYI